MNKKSIVISSVMVSILVLGTIVSSYAYFQSRLATGSSTPTTVKANTISGLTFNAGSNINLLVNQTNMASGASDLAASTEASVILKARNDASDNYNYKTCLNISSNNFVHSSVSSTETSYGMTKNMINISSYKNKSHIIVDDLTGVINGYSGYIYGVKFTIPEEYIGKQLTASAWVQTLEGNEDDIAICTKINGKQSCSEKFGGIDYEKMTKTFTPTTKSDTVFIAYYDYGQKYINLKEFQLELGSVATSYEPYGYISAPELVLTVTKNGTTILTQDITIKTGQVCVPTTNEGTTLTHNISASANATTTDTWKATVTFKNLSTNQNVNTNKELNANFVFTKI